MSGAHRVNQFGENDERPMNQDRWKEKWDAGQTRFHMPKVHPMLQKHVGSILEEKQNARVFMPMCGKSLDLKWLAEKGYQVIGNEYVELGCQQFFEENDIPFKKQPIGAIPGTLFESTDERYKIKLYSCDFFLLNSQIIGDLDAIWDRGSLAAINVDDRKRYHEVMCALMGSKTRMLLEVFHLDHEIFIGPPNDFPKEELHKTFGKEFNVQQLDEKDCLGDWQREWGVKYFISQIFLLTKKC